MALTLAIALCVIVIIGAPIALDHRLGQSFPGEGKVCRTGSRSRTRQWLGLRQRLSLFQIADTKGEGKNR
ncbi:MAG: hypothetical protein NTX25_11825 [Proteobacteria bacterium]|nr:hypothetical protein [Pseudomonadota bacterium]